jgi:hypothetical protein
VALFARGGSFSDAERRLGPRFSFPEKFEIGNIDAAERLPVGLIFALRHARGKEPAGTPALLWLIAPAALERIGGSPELVRSVGGQSGFRGRRWLLVVANLARRHRWDAFAGAFLDRLARRGLASAWYRGAWKVAGHWGGNRNRRPRRG